MVRLRPPRGLPHRPLNQNHWKTAGPNAAVQPKDLPLADATEALLGARSLLAEPTKALRVTQSDAYQSAEPLRAT
jgi:hypothetical protein